MSEDYRDLILEQFNEDLEDVISEINETVTEILQDKFFYVDETTIERIVSRVMATLRDEAQERILPFQNDYNAFMDGDE